MAGAIDICNLALGRIKQGSIASFAEDSAEAQECARLYEISRDYVLADFPWRMNTVLRSLTLMTNDREDDWDFKYQRPACLKLREVLPETGRRRPRKRIKFEQTSEGIYTDAEFARVIIHTLVDDTTLYSPALVSCIAWRLAYDLVGPLDADMGMMQWADRKYEREKTAAWTTDAAEDIISDDDADEVNGSGELPTMISCRE